MITAKSTPCLRHGRPAALNALQNLDDHDIVEAYGAQYRGIVQYYLLAGDVYRLNRLRWVMESSLLKTLAAKHGSSMSAMAARYKTVISTPHGTRTCFEAVRQREENRKPQVARFGGIPLKRRKYAVISDRIPGQNPSRHKELVIRLLRERCELCGNSGQVQAHHIARLAELTPPSPGQPPWAKLMVKMRRKSLVVCEPCHDYIHTGQPSAAIPATT